MGLAGKTNKLLILLFLFLGSLITAAELQVYQPTNIPVKQRDKKLKSDTALQGVDITVFGKYKELSSSLKRTKVNYLIVPSSFSLLHKNYKPVYQFTKNGNSTFRYKILSLSSKWTKQQFHAGSIGMVDQLGRVGNKKFIENNIGKFKLVKKVPKVDDLMPLLVLENADYIMVSPGNYDILKAKFSAATISVTESKPVGYPVICVLKGTSEEEIQKLGKISQQTIQSLGFTGLKRIEARANK